MSGDVTAFTILILSASTFYVAGLATLLGAWYLEKLPPEPNPISSHWKKAKAVIPARKFAQVVDKAEHRVSFRF